MKSAEKGLRRFKRRGRSDGRIDRGDEVARGRRLAKCGVGRDDGCGSYRQEYISAAAALGKLIQSILTENEMGQNDSRIEATVSTQKVNAYRARVG